MTRIRAALLLVLIGVLARPITSYWTGLADETPSLTPRAASRPLPRETVFRELRAAIGDRRTIGYFSDQPTTGLFYVTQYELSPTLVLPLDEASDTDLVVGVAVDAGALAKLADELDLEAIRGFGGGLVLYRRAR